MALQNYWSQLNTTEKSRYSDKLGIIGLKECPYALPDEKWRDDLTEWPEIEYGDIYEYLINSPGNFSIYWFI